MGRPQSEMNSLNFFSFFFYSHDTSIVGRKKKNYINHYKQQKSIWFCSIWWDLFNLFVMRGWERILIVATTLEGGTYSSRKQSHVI